MAIVANTAPWTYLGDRPLLPSPEASFDTGLDLYALTRLRTVGTLRRGSPPAAWPAVGPATRARGPWSTGSTTCPELTLRASRPVATQVDGEALGDLESLTFRSVPDALRVVV